MQVFLTGATGYIGLCRGRPADRAQETLRWRPRRPDVLEGYRAWLLRA